MTTGPQPPLPPGSGAVSEVVERLTERCGEHERERSRQEIRRLFDTAWTVLERNGEGIKVEVLLRCARVGTNRFYRYFAGKTEFVLALMEDEFGRQRQWREEMSARTDDPVACVTDWIDAAFSVAEDERWALRVRLFLAEWRLLERDYPDQAHEIIRHMLAPLRDAIAAGRLSGAFPAADPEIDGLAIYQLTSAMVHQPLGAELPVERRALRDAAVDFALCTLTAARRTRSVDAPASPPSEKRAFPTRPLPAADGTGIIASEHHGETNT